MLQPNLQPTADRLNRRDHVTYLQELLAVVGQLTVLHLQRFALLHQLPLPPLKLCQFNRFRQVRRQQALALPAEAGERRLDRRPPMLQFLGEPVPTMRARAPV